MCYAGACTFNQNEHPMDVETDGNLQQQQQQNDFLLNRSINFIESGYFLWQPSQPFSNKRREMFTRIKTRQEINLLHATGTLLLKRGSFLI